MQEALPSRDTGDQIASLLMEQLGGLQYPDDLVTFCSDMSQLMHSHASALDVDAMKGGADISSAFGFYIRHCCVSFHMLSFEVRSPCMLKPRDHLHLPCHCVAVCTVYTNTVDTLNDVNTRSEPQETLYHHFVTGHTKAQGV